MNTIQEILCIFPETSNHGLNSSCNILIYGNQVPQIEYMAIKTYLKKMERVFRKSGQLMHRVNLFDTAKRGQVLSFPGSHILLPVKMGSGKRNNTGYLSLAHVRAVYTDGDGYATAVLQYGESSENTLSIHLLCKAESVMERIQRAFRKFPELDNQSIGGSALSVDKLIEEYLKRKRGPHLLQNEAWKQFIKDCASHYRYKTEEEVRGLISSWRNLLKNAQNDEEKEEKEFFLDRLEMACFGLHDVLTVDTVYETVKGNGTETSPEVQVPKKVRLPEKRINTGWDEDMPFSAFASIDVSAFVKAVNVSPLMESLQKLSEGLRNMGVFDGLARMTRDMGKILQQESAFTKFFSDETQKSLREVMGAPFISTTMAESLKLAAKPPLLAAEISQTMRTIQERATVMPKMTSLIRMNPMDCQGLIRPLGTMGWDAAGLTHPLGTLNPSCFTNAGLIHQAAYASKLVNSSYWPRQMGVVDDSDE
ncbi:hypothetical protein [uncultured Dialister sp.]|jgi:hypothetical protein|uniref:hypothetical protein n=1 Tax=uncultured Dialister sp. TaxID=278064 RepID=UPI002630973B|nr:hypothetical protein [uncultured Dialister sp.]